MRTRLALALAVFGGLAITARGVMLAAPGRDQSGQDRPGQIGQAKVFVENHNRNEAVPVILTDVMIPVPLGVQVIGTPTVAIAPASVVQARLVRQVWEYRTVNIPTGQDSVAVLSTAGADGWEATGVQWPSPSGNLIVLKRPR